MPVKGERKRIGCQPEGGGKQRRGGWKIKLEGTAKNEKKRKLQCGNLCEEFIITLTISWLHTVTC